MGTKYTKQLKHEITNRIKNLEDSLKWVDINALTKSVLPYEVNVTLKESVFPWKIENMQKAENTKIPNTEQELSDYDKMNNKQSWKKIVEERKKIHDSIEKTKQIRSPQPKTRKLIIGADKKNRSKTFFGLHDTLKWTWKGR